MNQTKHLQQDDVDLVCGIKEGCKDDEEKYIRNYRGKIFGMLSNLVGDDSRAEDLTHDALLVVLQKLRTGGVSDPEKLSSYTFSTARFMYYGWLRKKDSQLVLRETMDDIATPGLPVEADLMLKERRGLLDKALGSLSVFRDRDILKRHYLLEQSKKEVCETLLLSSQHYDRVLSRARQRLRTCVSLDLL